MLREKEKIRLMEKARPDGELKKTKQQQAENEAPKTYGKDVKGIFFLGKFCFSFFFKNTADPLTVRFRYSFVYVEAR